MSQIDEAEFVKRLGQMATDGVRSVADHVTAGLGNSKAVGRLGLASAVKQMTKDWNVYVGQKTRAGNKRIGKQPTLQNLLDFMLYAYGIELDESSLRKAMGLPSEDTVSEALTDTFDPHTVFPKLADFLLDRGLLKFQYKDKTYGANGVKSDSPEPRAKSKGAPIKQASYTKNPTNDNHPQDNDPKDTTTNTSQDHTTDTTQPNPAPPEDTAPPTPEGDPQTVSARVTPDGHSIDIEKMKKSLIADNISGKDMAFLEDVMEGKNAYNLVKSNPQTMRTLAAIVKAVLRSITSKNSPDNIEAQHSITTSGNVIDINEFVENLHEKEITGAELDYIRHIFDRNNENKMSFIQALDNDDKVFDIVFGIAWATLMATSRD